MYLTHKHLPFHMGHNIAMSYLVNTSWMPRAIGSCNLPPKSDGQYKNGKCYVSLTRISPISLEELGTDAVHFQEGHVGQEAGYLHPGAEHPSLNG